MPLAPELCGWLALVKPKAAKDTSPPRPARSPDAEVAFKRGDAVPVAPLVVAIESRCLAELAELAGPGALERPVAGVRGLSRPAGVKTSRSKLVAWRGRWLPFCGA